MRSAASSAWPLCALAWLCACTTELAPHPDDNIEEAADVDAGIVVAEPTNLSERECPDDNILRYDNFAAPLFVVYCTGCHHEQQREDMRQGAPLGVDFETLAKVRNSADSIYLHAADAHESMPPQGGPSTELRYQLGNWLACGAPE